MFGKEIGRDFIVLIAKKAKAWVKMEEAFEKKEILSGRITGKVKGAFTIEMQDAKAFQTFEMQNLANKQQAEVLNKQMRATILGQELTNQQQTAVINASKFTEANNLNFTSDQTVALEESKMAQQLKLTNVSNKQAMAVKELLLWWVWIWLI